MKGYQPKVVETYWSHKASVEDIGALLSGNIERRFTHKKPNLFRMDEVISYGENGQRQEIPVRYVVEKMPNNSWLSYVLIKNTDVSRDLIAKGDVETIDRVARKGLDQVLRQLEFNMNGYKNLVADAANGFMTGPKTMDKKG